jgi:hypothetical protein
MLFAKVIIWTFSALVMHPNYLNIAGITLGRMNKLDGHFITLLLIFQMFPPGWMNELDGLFIFSLILQVFPPFHPSCPINVLEFADFYNLVLLK